jgi:hypothetical protein
MRRILPLIIIFILLLSVIGYFPLLKLKQFEIRKEVRAHLHSPLVEEALCTISVMQENKQQLTWEEEGVEFEYEGRMYDIVSSDTLNGVIHYHCLADDAESDLLNRLENLLADESDEEVSAGKIMNKLVKALYSFLYVLSDKTALAKWGAHYELPVIPEHLRFPAFIKDILQPPQ